MKLTRKKIAEIVRANMTEADALHYVPVQKLTLALCMLAAADRCKRCGGKPSACEGCEVSILGEKLEDSLTCPPVFDEDFNVLPPPEEKPEQEKKDA